MRSRMGYKVLADSNGEVPNGGQARNDLAKVLDSAESVLDDKESLLKAFSNAGAVLDAKAKEVNDTVSINA